jgi:hypothetical protein
MKKFLKLTKILINKIRTSITDYIYGPTPLWNFVNLSVTKECSSYVQDKMGESLQFKYKHEFWKFVLDACQKKEFWEFGVCKGESLTYFAKHFKIAHGFDSFIGLREDWAGHNLPAGAFSVNGKVPRVPQNTIIHAGWFTETLPGFLKKNKATPDLVHIDCDTYESSAYVLDKIANRLKKNCHIIFDEYLLYRGWKNGEFKAWQEVRRKHNLKFEYICLSEMSVAIKIINHEK